MEKNPFAEVRGREGRFSPCRWTLDGQITLGFSASRILLRRLWIGGKGIPGPCSFVCGVFMVPGMFVLWVWGGRGLVILKHQCWASLVPGYRNMFNLPAFQTQEHFRTWDANVWNWKFLPTDRTSIPFCSMASPGSVHFNHGPELTVNHFLGKRAKMSPCGETRLSEEQVQLNFPWMETCFQISKWETEDICSAVFFFSNKRSQLYSAWAFSHPWAGWHFNMKRY